MRVESGGRVADRGIYGDSWAMANGCISFSSGDTGDLDSSTWSFCAVSVSGVAEATLSCSGSSPFYFYSLSMI